MKRNQVTLGGQVVCNNHPYAQVYTVTHLDDFIATLEHTGENGKEECFANVDILQMPTLEQLNNDKPLNL